MNPSTATTTPLRQRMLEDMRMRKMSPKTQSAYIHSVQRLAVYLHRSPDTANIKHQMALSVGGVHESRDAGRSWATLIEGMQVVEGFDAATVTFHDPHCVRICPSNPDRLYQQNHCGIYRLDWPGTAWQRIGREMPADVGDIGFPMVVHPYDADTAWVFPMDGTDVWPRTSPGGRPAAYVTHDGGRSWQRRKACRSSRPGGPSSARR